MTQPVIKSTDPPSVQTTSTTNTRYGYTLAARDDRLSLISSANRLIEAFVNLNSCAVMSSVPKEVELTDQETDTYNAALALLKLEFERGPVKLQNVPTRFETEITKIDTPSLSPEKDT